MSPADPSPTLEEGTLVAGKYRVGRPLGRGGMAEVFEAEHASLGTTLALKVLRPELARSSITVRRFSREAQAAAQLESDHVARVFDVGTLPGPDGGPPLPFIVMERLVGQDLHARLDQNGPVPLATAVDHLLQASEALAEAHARGIVHRDLKPSNLFLVARRPAGERIKVLDFGIAKALSGDAHPERAGTLTRTHDVLGSPRYMSPEQLLASSRVGVETDVWSLGVVLQELLTGQTPFNGPSVAAIHAAILEREPVPLVLPDGDPGQEEVAAVVRRCLRKEPRDRYRSIADLAEALAPLGSDEAQRSLAVVQQWGASTDVGRVTTAIGDEAHPEDTDTPDSFGATELPPTRREPHATPPDGDGEGGATAHSAHDPGSVTDTSWDRDTASGRARGRGVALGLIAVLGAAGAYVLMTNNATSSKAPPAAPAATAASKATVSGVEPNRPAPEPLSSADDPTDSPVATPSSLASASTAPSATLKPPARPARPWRSTPPPAADPRPAPPPSLYDSPR